MITSTFVPKEIAEKIKSAAVLHDVIEDYINLKPAGSQKVGICPNCGGKKFTVQVQKGLYKCFSGCEKGGNSSVKFLTDVMGMDYVEALINLADRYNILIEEPQQQKKRKPNNRKESFRNSQLKASGIPNAYQKIFITDGDKQLEINRYEAATMDSFGNVKTGDDMILHYIDIDKKVMQYKDRKGKFKPLMRVRWANPSLHLNREGKAIKYQSPKGSQSALWFPNALIEAFQKHSIINTLYICEGEKKADKMSIHGMLAVGIMGIHNLNFKGDMPYHFERIIKRCAVEKVVFVLDADWKELSKGQHVDYRPKTFFSSVKKVRDYFYGFVNEGIYLDVFFAYHLDQVHKGIDDLMALELKDKEPLLSKDFGMALVDRNGEGQFVNVHKITTISDYQLKSFWHLESTPKFIEYHRDELKKRVEFTIGGLKRRYNKENDEFELAQAVLKHEQFWTIKYVETKSGTVVKSYFSYRNIRSFLANRGFGLLPSKDGKNFRFIHINSRVVKEVEPHQIQKFVIDFAEEIGEKEVVEMLLRGGKQYLGQEKLSNMFYKTPEFLEPNYHEQYLVFKNCFWHITAEEVKSRPIAELPRHIWANKIIPFEPKYIGTMMKAERNQNDNWKLTLSDELKESDIAQFFMRTSNFHWQENTPINDEVRAFFQANLMAKILATGYVLHDFKDYSKMKAIICMDGVESEVGKSNGGTGKSIWATMFEHCFPVEILDGKKKNITDDPFIYDGVDERTQAIVFDDCRVNMDIEHFFSQITSGLKVNRKGEHRFKIKPPKFIFTTNHAFKGEGASFDRRQYYISFSDYYNPKRTVFDDFGHQLFHDWDYKQWNLFYNWMANCIQLFLKYRLQYNIPMDLVNRRKIRQFIGENFLEFMSIYYHTDEDDKGKKGMFLNHKIEKEYLIGKFKEKYTKEAKYVTSRNFKEKLIRYCEYANLEYNPTATNKEKRIKSNGNEYFIIADKDFNNDDCQTISTNQMLLKI